MKFHVLYEIFFHLRYIWIKTNFKSNSTLFLSSSVTSIDLCNYLFVSIQHPWQYNFIPSVLLGIQSILRNWIFLIEPHSQLSSYINASWASIGNRLPIESCRMRCGWLCSAHTTKLLLAIYKKCIFCYFYRDDKSLRIRAKGSHPTILRIKICFLFRTY